MSASVRSFSTIKPILFNLDLINILLQFLRLDTEIIRLNKFWINMTLCEGSGDTFSRHKAIKV